MSGDKSSSNSGSGDGSTGPVTRRNSGGTPPMSAADVEAVAECGKKDELHHMGHVSAMCMSGGDIVEHEWDHVPSEKQLEE